MASNIEEITDTADVGNTTINHDTNDGVGDPNTATETTTTSEIEKWSKGRVAALIVAAVMSGVSIVLATSYLMTRDHEYGITLRPLFVWEIILYTTAILAMVIFTYQRKNTKCVVQAMKPFSDAYMDFLFDSCSHDKRQNVDKLPFWTRIPLRIIGLCICCIGAIILPIHEMYRSLANMQCFEHRLVSFRVLNAVSKLCCVVFCICQTIFLLRFKTRSSRRTAVKLLLSTIVAANFTLCVDVVLNIKMAEDSLDVQTDISRVNLEKRPLFVTCESNMAKVDYTAEWI